MAIAVGGVFIAAGNVVRYAISGPTLPSFFTDIEFTLIDFVLAFSIFILAVLIFDFLLFKKFKVSDTVTAVFHVDGYNITNNNTTLKVNDTLQFQCYFTF